MPNLLLNSIKYSHSHTRTVICTFVFHSFIHSFVHSFIHSFIRAFIIYSCLLLLLILLLLPTPHNENMLQVGLYSLLVALSVND